MLVTIIDKNLDMSKRNKLQKFADIFNYSHVYENFDGKHPQLLGAQGEKVDLKGKWATDHFKNSQPITLELACGKGDYTIGLARMYPERNFIGVDVKGARIWRGATTALEEGLSNVAFLRCRIEQLHYFFAENEVSEIWITFPDPFLKKGKSNRRLTAPNFLKLYQKTLQKDGLIHLKTDSPELYEFTLKILRESDTHELLYEEENIYGKPLVMPELELKTFYEHMHLADGRKIKYVQMSEKIGKP